MPHLAAAMVLTSYGFHAEVRALLHGWFSGVPRHRPVNQ